LKLYFQHRRQSTEEKEAERQATNNLILTFNQQQAAMQLQMLKNKVNGDDYSVMPSNDDNYDYSLFESKKSRCQKAPSTVSSGNSDQKTSELSKSKKYFIK
jgi:hypothetical protein